MIPPELLSMPPKRTRPPEEAFLIRVAELLHTFGTPAFRLERVLLKVAGQLGIQASFLSTPTAVVASLGTGPDTVVHMMRSESGLVNLGKLVEFDEIMDQVAEGRLDPVRGLEQLEVVAAATSRYPVPLTALAFGTASAGAAVFFHGGPFELLAAFVVSIALMFFSEAVSRRSDAIGLFEPMAAFGASLASVFLAWAFGTDMRVVTLASLIVLIPGLTMTTGFIELATRHLVSGMSRLAGAGAVFFTLLLGVALGWRLGPILLGLDGITAAELARTTGELPAWFLWVAVAIGPFAFGIVLEARPKELPIIFLAAALGFVAAVGGGELLGADLGPFLGALVVGLVSNTYARLVRRPALVPLTPGIFMLVPGSLGFRSLTSFLDADSSAGVAWAFQTGLVAASLVGGLLLSNLLLPPRRVL
ncbi:MAG: threonine/serine exporter family protein [Planctomycetota bacterium]|nr:threonine/serine exporter family protein [Planctomycetota bacterium]